VVTGFLVVIVVPLVLRVVVFTVDLKVVSLGFVDVTLPLAVVDFRVVFVWAFYRFRLNITLFRKR